VKENYLFLFLYKIHYTADTLLAETDYSCSPVWSANQLFSFIFAETHPKRPFAKVGSRQGSAPTQINQNLPDIVDVAILVQKGKFPVAVTGKAVLRPPGMLR
jgi:hypothetical protein